MRDDLLGYLLGALEPDEERRIEDRLEADPQLRQRLRVIRRGLEPLSSDDGLIDPPPGLAARACNYIDRPPQVDSFFARPAAEHAVARPEVAASYATGSASADAADAPDAADAADAAEAADAKSRTASSAPLASASTEPRQPASAPPSFASVALGFASAAAAGGFAPQPEAAEAVAVVRPARAAAVAMSPAVLGLTGEAGGRRWSMADLLVTAGVVAAASMLIVPALSAGRYQSQVTACREKLHRLGTALVDYSRIHGGVFPEVREAGPLSRAGIYAARLRDSRLIQDYADVTCPAARSARPEDSAEDPPIPELVRLASSSEAEVDELLARHSGMYGYALGYVDDDGYHVRRNRNRSTFIVLSDMPHDGTSGSRNHGCGGQNVWFEDGHVEFLNSCRLKHLSDHIFENRRGFVGAGLGPDDIVIGRNTDRPLIVPVGLAQ